MLAELVHHVIGVDPDRDWITLAAVVVAPVTPASFAARRARERAYGAIGMHDFGTATS